MAGQNFPDNTLYELDNLDVLRGMNSETVDLIATDPPFNTKRNRSSTAGFYVDNWKWGDTGLLPDQWAWNEVHPIWLEQVEDENKALWEVVNASRSSHSDDLAAYLCFMAVRLLEMHRILKPTGSLYLHCDPTASHYLKLLLDAIFGPGNLRNELIWHYTNASRGRKQFAKSHDIILWYSRSNTYTFNRDDILVPFQSGMTKWRYTRGGQAGKTMPQGKTPDDVIIMPSLNAMAKERTGSPDQKPLELYKKIVIASSNPGDLVLDPFAGCATTIIAARDQQRRWIGIDRRTDARFHVVCRMAGLAAAQAEKIKQRPDFGTWIAERLAHHDTHYSTQAPERTDDGETAPELPPVYATRRPATKTRREMVSILIEKYGLSCWGCGFTPPTAEYLELDHILPASEGGSNELENRALLCPPCNGRKSNRLTLTALRASNRREKRWYGEHQDGQEINLRDARAWAEHFLQQERQSGPMMFPGLQ